MNVKRNIVFKKADENLAKAIDKLVEGKRLVDKDYSFSSETVRLMKKGLLVEIEEGLRGASKEAKMTVAILQHAGLLNDSSPKPS